MRVSDSEYSSRSINRYIGYLSAIILLISFSAPVFSVSLYGAALAETNGLSTSFIYIMLTISAALIVISLLVTYFSIKLRKLNAELIARNKNILDENQDLLKIKNEMIFKKDRTGDEQFESEDFFRMIVQSVNDGIAFFNTENQIKYANPAFFSLTGIDKESFSLDKFIANLHPEFNDFLSRREQALLKDGYYENDLSIRRNGSSYSAISTRSAVVRNNNGEMTGSITVISDITRLRKGMDEMLKSNLESEAGNRLKAGFLANISHEIRTPLNSVVGFANLLLDDDLPKETREEYIEHINFNSEKLLQIIGDIIDLSRLSSSQIEITYEEASLSELIKEVVEEARTIIKRTDKPIILNVKKNTERSNDLVFTDRIWLKRVLNHLMDNAIKFTLDGSIEFMYTIDNDDILFTVKDTGIGINKENLARIFEEFRQEVDGNQRPFEGLGVGLTLAKEVIERMGGRIYVISEKGIGSEFTFNIPYRPAGSKNKLMHSSADHNLNMVNWQSKKCLLVDDNKDVLIYLNRILVDTGILILTARSGFEAIQIIKSNPDLDLVILDMQMPEMNGIEATKEIKKIRNNLPIIAQTAFVFENDTDIILEAGCDACLIKPIRRDHLITVMSSFIRPN